MDPEDLVKKQIENPREVIENLRKQIGKKVLVTVMHRGHSSSEGGVLKAVDSSGIEIKNIDGTKSTIPFGYSYDYEGGIETIHKIKHGEILWVSQSIRDLYKINAWLMGHKLRSL